MTGLVSALRTMPDIPFPAPLLFNRAAEKVNKHISELNQAILDQHGQEVVRYALYCKHYKPDLLPNLENQLRSFGSLLETNSIARVEKIWLTIYEALNMNIVMVPNIEQGTFAFYHLRYRLNYALTQSNYFSAAVVMWFMENPKSDQHLSINKLDMLLPENLEIFVRTAITQMRDSQANPNALNAELIFPNTIRLLKQIAKRYPQTLALALKWSLKVGNHHAVKAFMLAGASPSQQLGDYYDSALSALREKDESFVASLESAFGLPAVAQMLCREDNYVIAREFLKNNHELPLTRLERIGQIAANLGDLETIKHVLAHIPMAQRKAFYQANLLPYYRQAHVIKNSGELIASVSSREGLTKNFGPKTDFVEKRTVMIGTISWAMRSGQLDLNIDAEEKRPHVFGLQRLGRIRRQIALSNPYNKKNRYVFGLVRQRALYTPNIDLYVPHMEISHTHIDKRHYDQTRGLNAWTYQVKTQAFPNQAYADSLQLPRGMIPSGIYLTTYFEIAPEQIAPFHDYAFASRKNWQHTNAGEIKLLSRYINDMVQHFIQHALSSDIPPAQLAPLIAVIHYYFAHMTPYFRGSAAVGEAIICALLEILCGDYPDEFVELVDCVALRTPDIYEFIDEYPKLLGAESYAELVDKYARPAEDKDEIAETLRKALNLGI